MRSLPLDNGMDLFRDPDLFDPTYCPEHLCHRDAQVRELAFLISPGLKGRTIENSIIRGPPGTGKTTTVQWVFDRLREATDRIIPVYVNCRRNTTFNRIYQCIFEEIFSYDLPTAGRSTDEIEEAIIRRLGDMDARLLVCLDDANYLIPDQTEVYNLILYHLLKPHEHWEGAQSAGVIVVTSDLRTDLYGAADAPVRSAFHPTEVDFPPYAKAEILEILGERVQQGLYPGVVPVTVLDRVAQIAATEQDIRVGLTIIRMAVSQAGEKGRRRVRLADVESITTKSPILETRARSLSPAELDLLYHLAGRAWVGQDMMSGSVFEEVQGYLDIGRSTYHEYLKTLSDASIIDLVPGPGRGREREIRFRYDPEDVTSFCLGLE